MATLLLWLMLFAQDGALFEGLWHTELPKNLRGMSIVAVDWGLEFKVSPDAVVITRQMLTPSMTELPLKAMTYRTDGVSRRVAPRGDEETVTASWSNPRVLTVTFMQKSGALTRYTYEVSDDGMTLVWTLESPNSRQERLYHRLPSPLP